MLRLTTALAVLFAAAPSIAQCDVTWLPGPPNSGPDGSIAALLTLPNGDVVAGGTFTYADATLANHIARWDGVTWRAFGAGANAEVRCLAQLPNGDLIAGGSFTTMGGASCSHIARWNGTGWSALGTGLDAAVEALLVLPNGDLIAGGSFVMAGPVQVSGVARWNGTAWSAIGTPVPCTCHALALRPNGDLYVGGEFPLYMSDALMFWNGTQWQFVPGFDPFSDPNVGDLATLANGDLAMNGSFSINAQPQTLAVWNGTALQPLVAPVGNGNRALSGAANGDLLLGGTANQTSQVSLSRWNGTTWTTVAGAPADIQALAEDASGRIVAGSSVVGGLPRPCPVARLAGAQWQSLGAPLPPRPQALLTMPNGDVVAGGVFTSIGGVAANHIAKWNGSQWTPLGLGVDGPVRTLALASNGDVIASGSFSHAGGAPANGIARWSGAAWSPLGIGLPTEASALTCLPNGEIFAITSLPVSLRRFNGGQWSQVQFAILAAIPQSLTALADGTLAIGGTFVGGGLLTGLAIYSGGTPTLVPNIPTSVSHIVEDANGLYLLNGTMLRHWDGTTVTAFPGATVSALALLPNGDVLAGGSTQTVTGATTPSALFRLTASRWDPFGAVQGGSALCVAVSARGEIFAGGTFSTNAGGACFGIAHAQPTCAAAAQVIGAGCTGGAGPVTLTARSLPWAGGVLLGEATGMTSNSVALQLLGLQSTAGPLPGGGPGCSLFVNPLLAEVLLPSNGLATAAFQVPNQPSLAGLTFRLQVVGIELGTAGIVRLTSTNAIEATVGVL